jgi:hypothetical protein
MLLHYTTKLLQDMPLYAALCHGQIGLLLSVVSSLQGRITGGALGRKVRACLRCCTGCFMGHVHTKASSYAWAMFLLHNHVH